MPVMDEQCEQPSIGTEDGKQGTAMTSMHGLCATPSHTRSVTEKADEEEVCSEVIIHMINQDESAWDSEVDGLSSGMSDTSTPGYKHGKHQFTQPIPGLELEAIEQIKLDCRQIRKGTRRPPSVHILADAMMDFWPKK